MTALDAMHILRQFKDRDAGKLPDRPMFCNQGISVSVGWYQMFAALLKTHPSVEVDPDSEIFILSEFHDWRDCDLEDCRECQALVDYGIVMACDECHTPGLSDCDGFVLDHPSSDRVLCSHCDEKRRPNF